MHKYWSSGSLEPAKSRFCSFFLVRVFGGLDKHQTKHKILNIEIQLAAGELKELKFLFENDSCCHILVSATHHGVS
jgi:hypothetical protein